MKTAFSVIVFLCSSFGFSQNSAELCPQIIANLKSAQSDKQYLRDLGYAKLYVDELKLNGDPVPWNRIQGVEYSRAPMNFKHVPQFFRPDSEDVVFIKLEGQSIPIGLIREKKGILMWQPFVPTNLYSRTPIGRKIKKAITKISKRTDSLGLSNSRAQVNEMRVNLGVPIMLPRFHSVFTPGSIYINKLLSVVHPLIKENDRVLVIGTGSGVDSVVLAAKGAQVDATDINPIALVNTRASAVLTGTQSRIRAFQSDVFDRVTDKYNYIIFDAPLAIKSSMAKAFKFEGENPNLHDPEAKILRSLIAGLENHLLDGGKLFVMTHKELPVELPSHLYLKTHEHWGKGLVKFAIQEIGLIP